MDLSRCPEEYIVFLSTLTKEQLIELMAHEYVTHHKTKINYLFMYQTARYGERKDEIQRNWKGHCRQMEDRPLPPELDYAAWYASR